MELTECFHATLDMPDISSGQEAVRVLQGLGASYDKESLRFIMEGFSEPVPVKKLLLIAEMAKSGAPDVPLGQRFLESMAVYHNK